MGVEECDTDDEGRNTDGVFAAPRADVGGWIGVGAEEVEDRAEVHCSDEATELVVEA